MDVGIECAKIFRNSSRTNNRYPSLEMAGKALDG